MMSSVSRTPRSLASGRALSTPLAVFTGLVVSCGIAGAQTISAPYSADYSIGYNAPIAGVSTNYGGLIFEQGDPNTLLIMGSENGSGGTLYSVPVIRGAGGQISGFGTASFFSTAPYNDGGLVYAPNGDLLFTQFPLNGVGEIKPGSTAPDKTVTLSGVNGSVGTMQYVPSGFSNAGQLKIASYAGGGWYDATLTDDGSGTYNIGTTYTGVNTPFPEGIVYVKGGNPDFSANSVLVSTEAGYTSTGFYADTTDSDGNPNVGSAGTFGQPFITDLITDLIVYGGTVDPVTGDVVFSGSGSSGLSNRVVVVEGFTDQVAATPEPGSLALLIGAGLSGGTVLWKRRRRNRK